MTPAEDYPRMLFHRVRGTVIVHSRDEEEELGGEWSRTIFPPDSLMGEAPPSPYDPPAPPKRSHKKKVVTDARQTA